MRPRWLLGFVAIVGLAAFGAWMAKRPRPKPGPAAVPVVGARLFDAVFTRIRNNAVDPLDEQELYRRAAQGVIKELDDPYAVLRLPGQNPPPPDDAPTAQGLFLDRRDGQAIVVATVPGSPADSAGVRDGDQLLGIDSAGIDGRLDRAAALLEGTSGTTLTLRVRRGTGRTFSVTVRRGPVARRGAIERSALGGGVGRVQVRRFLPGIADSVRKVVEQLRAEGARSLVLDLRNAVGGGSDLAHGVELADLFLDRGAVIAVNRARPASASVTFRDSTASPFSEMPLAVLIDAGTAGAAEVVAGALQDHDRAIVLGATSFGRGVTQTTFSLGHGASLTMTTALWITPNGRQIQRPPRPATGDSLPRPKFKSDAGRLVLGGGGIVPDRLIVEGGATDLALAEAHRVLARARSPQAVLALVAK